MIGFFPNSTVNSADRCDILSAFFMSEARFRTARTPRNRSERKKSSPREKNAPQNRKTADTNGKIRPFPPRASTEVSP